MAFRPGSGGDRSPKGVFPPVNGPGPVCVTLLQISEIVEQKQQLEKF
jgi:hypothetical protein